MADESQKQLAKLYDSVLDRFRETSGPVELDATEQRAIRFQAAKTEFLGHVNRKMRRSGKKAR